MKIEVTIDEASSKACKGLETKVDAIADQLTEFRQYFEENVARQQLAIDKATAALKHSNDSLESAIKSIKGKL